MAFCDDMGFLEAEFLLLQTTANFFFFFEMPYSLKMELYPNLEVFAAEAAELNAKTKATQKTSIAHAQLRSGDFLSFSCSLSRSRSNSNTQLN